MYQKTKTTERIGPLRIQVVPDKYKTDIVNLIIREERERQRREENRLPLNRTYIPPYNTEIKH